jgi:hypothetical protein
VVEKAFKPYSVHISSREVEKVTEIEKESEAKLCVARNATAHSENIATHSNLTF